MPYRFISAHDQASACNSFSLTLDNHSHLLQIILMIICICNNINGRAAKEAVDAGARSPREVLAKNGCKFNCGKCKCAMGEFIAAEMDKRIESIDLIAAE